MSDNYVECEVTLKQLFDCFNFDYTKKDEFQTIGNVQIRDENNNWIDIKKLIIKTDDIIELTFSDNTKLRAAANHIISLYPNKEIGKLVKNFEIGDFIPYKDIIVTDKRLIAVKQRVYGINVDSFKHLYKDYNGIIHRNTHEIMTTCKKYIGQNPTKAELIYEAGDIGSNMSSLIPFFYKNSDNKIIVLDDNDKMLMANCQQDIQNIMKAILDPKAEDEKPITVRSSMLGTFARSYMDMMDESIEFEIEPESLLRENRLKLWLNDNLVVNRILNPKDAKKLIEASWLNPYEDMEEDDIVEEGEEVTKKGKNGRRGRASSNEESDFKFPRKFLFNSSVIFISNLEMDQISPAVLDRCETKNIKLNLEQFLDRLGSIYGGLCNGGKNSTIPKPVRDWSKKCVYTALNLVIKAWERNVALFGKPVEINRKLTFRMFDEFVNAHFRYSLALAEKHNASLSDEHFREAISQYVLKDLISLKMLPWMATETRV
jgi:hypothetical protein